MCQCNTNTKEKNRHSAFIKKKKGNRGANFRKRISMLKTEQNFPKDLQPTPKFPASGIVLSVLSLNYSSCSC